MFSRVNGKVKVLAVAGAAVSLVEFKTRRTAADRTVDRVIAPSITAAIVHSTRR